jgi:hypothetical protein
MTVRQGPLYSRGSACDEVSTASGSDRVTLVAITRQWSGATRSLSLPVLTS